MKLMRISTVVLATFVIGVAPTASFDEPSGGDAGESKRADIYDAAADAEKQIEAALRNAKRDHKRVLLQFGANWCGWCHKLHELFQKDREIRRTLSYEYDVVMIDVNNRNGPRRNQAIVEKYGNPVRHGLPVLVVLDADGKQLTTQETGSLEKGSEHDPVKVLAFLDQWKAPAVDAGDVLSTARARARQDKKRVFLQFSAPWCGWCHRLSDVLSAEPVAAVFNAAYVPVKIDVDRMTGGAELMAKYARDHKGLPFFVVLDADGTALADSVGPEGNVGCPVKPAEIEHFIKVVRQTGRGLTDEQISTLESGFRQLAEKLKR